MSAARIMDENSSIYNSFLFRIFVKTKTNRNLAIRTLKRLKKGVLLGIFQSISVHETNNTNGYSKLTLIVSQKVFFCIGRYVSTLIKISLNT